ncbi:MAG: hypothetical protein U5L96_21340 [Owenweeksia sp.]|nr:hypothetical protein [Owenweeksia sp.]
MLALERLQQGQYEMAQQRAIVALTQANNEKALRGKLYNLLARIKLAQGDATKASAYLKNAQLIHQRLGREAEGSRITCHSSKSGSF